MISKVRINDHLQQYKRLRVPTRFNKKIIYVINGIKLPENAPAKDPHAKPLEVIYVGRGTEEKRVHLIAMAAKMCHQKKLDVKISFIGEVKYAVPEDLHQYCTFYGNISDEAILNSIYERSHVLLMTSTTEGFPMVVMEAMAYGLAIISTDVGDLPVHVLNGKNGFLISQNSNEDDIVQDAVKYIEMLSLNRELLRSIGVENIAYAKLYFGIDQFKRTYQELFKENDVSKSS
jgi:glycosyltransferase involved in cell wall biosynthesis